MVLDTYKRIVRDKGDPDEREVPWLSRENPWLLNVYNELMERRKNR